MTNKKDELNYEWLKCEGEPNLWFDRFFFFYIPASFPTSYTRHNPLTAAYKYWLEERAKLGDKQAQKKLKDSNIYPDDNWVKACSLYNWETRAKTFKTRQVYLRINEKEDRLFDILDLRLSSITLASEMIRNMLLKGKKYTDPNYEFKDEHHYRATANAIASLIRSMDESVEHLCGLSGIESLLNEKIENQKKIRG